MSAGQESTLGGDGKHACKVEWLGERERKTVEKRHEH